MKSLLKRFTRGPSLVHEQEAQETQEAAQEAQEAAQEAFGTCVLGFISNQRLYKPKPVVSINEDNLKAELTDTTCAAYLFNCNEIECRGFLLKLVEWCDRLHPQQGLFVINDSSEKQEKFNFKKYADKFRDHSGIRLHIFFYLCSLDRVCIHLLAKLRCNGYVPVLSYGTRIVSFENEQDLIDSFVSLNLERVDQIQSNMPLHCSMELSEHVNQDQRWWIDMHDTAIQKDYLRLDNEGKLGELRELDFTLFDKHEHQESLGKFCKLATCVELHFHIQSNAVQIPSSSNNVMNHSQEAFQVQVNVESRRNLSAITLLALQVPTLRSIAIEGGNLLVLQQKLIKSVRDFPTKNSRSMDMMVYPLRGVFGTREKHCFYVSDELLDIFNESKLVGMRIYLRNKGSYYLLDKVVDTISKSKYLERLEFEMKATHDREDWVRVCDFIGKFARIAPTLIRPVDIHFSFDGFYNFDFIAKAEANLLRIKKIMNAMADKHLQILDVLVGANMFEPRRNCPVAMIPMDVFWTLKEFLVPCEMQYDKYDGSYKFM